eukprot:11241551-Alexandrium_andersonii.AAC.1
MSTVGGPMAMLPLIGSPKLRQTLPSCRKPSWAARPWLERLSKHASRGGMRPLQKLEPTNEGG